MEVAALEGGFGQDFPDRGAKASVIVGDNEFDVAQASPPQVEEEVLP
jgi:hypothetical protein